jgi:predicted MPP superfamily phosphohydrolase
MESTLRVLYTGHWPALLWSLFPTAHRVRLVRQSAPLGLAELPPCRIAFVSDLHIGPTTPEPLLRRVFAAIRDARPDVLLLGGDYVYLDATEAGLRLLADLVSTVACPVKLGVLGNHDLWTHDRRIVAALESAGAAALVNQAVALPPPWEQVAVVGLDDPWTGNCDAEAAFATVPEHSARIVLCHAPDGLLQLEHRRFDLYLCGHTHGGQIATPWGPLVMPRGTLCRQFHAGPSQMHGSTVLVSRGVGGVELPVRLYAPPDVILVECGGSGPATTCGPVFCSPRGDPPA